MTKQKRLASLKQTEEGSFLDENKMSFSRRYLITTPFFPRKTFLYAFFISALIYTFAACGLFGFDRKLLENIISLTTSWLTSSLLLGAMALGFKFSAIIGTLFGFSHFLKNDCKCYLIGNGNISVDEAIQQEFKKEGRSSTNLREITENTPLKQETKRKSSMVRCTII